MLLFFIALAMTVSVNFTIIHEKVNRNDSLKLSEFVIRKILEEYNTVFRDFGVQFQLETIHSYDKYSKIAEYRRFSQLVGTGDLQKRLSALEKLDTNLIILFSSLKTHDTTKFNILDFCRGRLFVNLKEFAIDTDITAASISSISKWISLVLNLKLPEIYEIRNFNLKKALEGDSLKKALWCSNRKSQSETRSVTRYKPLLDGVSLDNIGSQSYTIDSLTKPILDSTETEDQIKAKMQTKEKRKLARKFVFPKKPI